MTKDQLITLLNTVEANMDRMMCLNLGTNPPVCVHTENGLRFDDLLTISRLLLEKIGENRYASCVAKPVSVEEAKEALIIWKKNEPRTKSVWDIPEYVVKTINTLLTHASEDKQ